MRRAGKVVAEVLDLLREAVRPGISTGELDRMAEEHIRSCGAAPAFKGYRPAPSMSPFPGTICASINEEIVHGFPSDGRRLNFARLRAFCLRQRKAHRKFSKFIRFFATR